jgi:hypothetical protein
MCQLICVPAESVVTKKVLERAWRENPHGGGYAFRRGGTVYIQKGFFDFDSFWRAYRAEAVGSDALLHFRFATHGAQNEANTHPFVLANNLVAGHNGVLSRFLPSPHDPRSDTRVFLEDYYAPALGGNPTVETLEALRPLVQRLIGGSKIALLGTHGFTIYNEGLGEWHDGVWYSAGYPAPSRDRWVDRYAMYDDMGSHKEWDGSSWWEWEEEGGGEELACVLCNEHTESPLSLSGETLCAECFDTLST